MDAVTAEEQWRELFELLDQARYVDGPDELHLARVGSALGSVGLVKPFRWTSWRTPFPRVEEIPSLSLTDCVRQVTRIVRADRTNEGILWGALQSGDLAAICRVAHRLNAGEVVGPLDDLEPDTSRESDHVGHPPAPTAIQSSGDEMNSEPQHERESKIRSLALSIARCDQIADACVNRKHPCHKIVTSQRELGAEYRHVPEAWAGDLVDAKILYVSSNPSISTPRVDGTGEDYPLAGFANPEIEHPSWPERRVIEFQVDRLNQEREQPFVNGKAQFLCVDGEYRGSDRENGTRTSQKYWKAAMKQAEDLLGADFDLSRDMCMTEIVHCKSKGENGVAEASSMCSEKFLPSIFEQSNASLVLVGGARARDRVHENRDFWSSDLRFEWQIAEKFGYFRHGTWEPRDHVGLILGHGRSRVVIATEQLSYASNKFRFVDKIIGPGPTGRLIQLLRSPHEFSFRRRIDLLDYLGM